MKILINGKNPKSIEELAKNLGLKVVSTNPDVIISFGGDGTLLSAERKYPGIPKLPIRDPLVWKKCGQHSEELLLRLLSQDKLQLKEYNKLETVVEGQTITALNDFIIRNKEAVHAIRFQVTVPSHPERAKPFGSEPQGRRRVEGSILIGDGIIVATPLGSSGYFKSVTQQTFNSGFGLAFNNTTEKIQPIIFKKGDQVTFKLIRGHGSLTFDNSHYQYSIKEGGEITFKLSLQTAKIYEAKTLRCPDCNKISN